METQHRIRQNTFPNMGKDTGGVFSSLNGSNLKFLKDTPIQNYKKKRKRNPIPFEYINFFFYSFSKRKGIERRGTLLLGEL